MKTLSDSPAATLDAKPGSPTAAPSSRPLVSIDSRVFKDVKVSLCVKLGEVELSIEDLMNLKMIQW